MIKCKDAIKFGSACGLDICCICCDKKPECNHVCFELSGRKPERCPYRVIKKDADDKGGDTRNDRK